MEVKRNQVACSAILVVVGLIFALCFFGCSGSIDGSYTGIKTPGVEEEIEDGEKPGNGEKPGIDEDPDDGEEPSDDVKVKFSHTFSEPQDETITLNAQETLSWADNDALELAVTESFDSYLWKYFDIDGFKEVEGNALLLNARDFPIGTNIVSLEVKNNGISYTKTVYFTVN